MVNPVAAVTDYVDATIASAASLSDSIGTGGRVLVGLYMPAAWTAASITFEVSDDGSTFYDLQTESAEYSVSAAASQYVRIDHNNFYGAKYLKVRSGTSASAVNQGAERVITLVMGDPND